MLPANFPALGSFGAVPTAELRSWEGCLTQATRANKASVTCRAQDLGAGTSWYEQGVHIGGVGGRVKP